MSLQLKTNGTLTLRLPVKFPSSEGLFVYVHIVLVLVLFSSWGHPANPSTGVIDGMVSACFSLKLCT